MFRFFMSGKEMQRNMQRHKTFWGSTGGLSQGGAALDGACHDIITL